MEIGKKTTIGPCVVYHQHQHCLGIVRNADMLSAMPDLVNQALQFEKDLQVSNMHVKAW